MFGFCSVTMPTKFPQINHLLFVLIVLGLLACDFNNKNTSVSTATNSSKYLNHHDSAKYVGIQTCKLCHQNIYNTFIQTGMGQSFDSATSSKSKAVFNHDVIYDKNNNMHYSASFQNNFMFIHEFRLSNKDTVFQRNEQVNYIVGSGQHTNSHIQNVNGYLNQMPMTFYTQKKKWDLPPGFENGNNTRFSRKIGLECMSCHNAYPQFVEGSENKYKAVPHGIDCERCHGPGSIHVAQKQSGQIVDTSKYIDYSIVNPAKLSIDAQFDVCQRCHLQGNTILKEGKSFFDFKPGQKLSDYMSVFLPKYANADKDFIMASHADRLKQSACFIKSSKNADSKKLKPYQGALTCVTCHNPHISVRETNKNVFNNACLDCHPNISSSATHTSNKNKQFDNCVSCHMPTSGSIDIPHVSVHDHYIRKPITEKEKSQIKQFLGLFSINEKNPNAITKAAAYLNQYEKFDAKLFYLDSADLLLNKLDGASALSLKIQLYFIKKDFLKVLVVLEKEISNSSNKVLFNQKSLDNRDAWTCYRIAESFTYLNQTNKALNWIEQAVQLAPYNLEFRNKLATVYASVNQVQKAEKEWEFILNENPKFLAAYTNLGYIKLQKNQTAEALQLFSKGLQLDPDNESLLLNLVSYYLSNNNRNMAIFYLKQLLSLHPNNIKAKQALIQLNQHG